MTDVEKTPAVTKEATETGLKALPAGANDDGAIPKGQIDPVYEAKARVLNRAVSSSHHVILLVSDLR